jgi:RHS repeat-associated protein
VFIVKPFAAILLSYLLIFMAIPRTPSAILFKSATRHALPSNVTQERPASRDREVLVRFRADVSRQAQDILLATHGARHQRALRGESRVEKIELPTGHDPFTAAAQMRVNPEVEFAEPNFLIEKSDLTPNDPSFDEQWGLNNTGQNGGQFGSDIDATAAWQTTTGSQATVVAVIDSGIDFTHPDLTNNIWTNPQPSQSGDLNGWDYITDNGTIRDEQGHGTAIAGIIAARGNNGIGLSGVMWNASLMSLRVLDNTGTGDVSDAVEAIDYAASHGAHVINISWGTIGESVILKDAIERAIDRGVAVVCSAGNGGQNVDSNPYYPASFNIRDLIVVAASDNFDQLTSWSNWGHSRVTIAAPGTNILTTRMGGGYWQTTGTSASAPFVTGLVGLMKSVRPWLNARQVESALYHGARRVASLSGKVESGGVANAAESVQRALQGNQPPVMYPPGYGSGGSGPGGSFSTTPPPTTTGAPGPNLRNLDELRNMTPQEPRARQPIQSNLVCADCDPQSGGGGSGYYPANDPNFSTARGRPENQAGEPGEDLGSRNFNWSLPLLSLQGRAGMDLGLTLYYNSLVWTKDGSYIKFNADLGSPAPGFRLSLPKLQAGYPDADSGEWSYMLVTSSGSRVELRRTAPGSVIYESIDGSYTQMDTSPSPYYVLIKTADGTQMKLEPVSVNGEYRATELKDRNGNRITATYNYTNGHLQTITDTLGRVITFAYNANNNLEAIRQTWAGVSHDWATFSYGDVFVNPQFASGLLVNGPNNNSVTVLTQVSLHDGSYYTFQYNGAFGQVYRINHHAAGSNLLSYTSYNLSTATGQTDCPRFTERRDWAENWNNSAEAVTTYSVAGDNSWTKVTAPDNTVYKEWFATTPAWKKGLTTESRNYATVADATNDTWKKKTTISWTQDDVNLAYQKNARVTETIVDDSDGNHKRVVIDYGTYWNYSLPYVVVEYAADNTTALRGTYTDYNLSSTYTSRRIIGLVSAVHVVDFTTSTYVSKTTFDYDTGGEYLVATPQTASQHDVTNYGSGFVSGRGNLTEVKRWDVTNINTINDPSKAISTRRTGYNSTGAPTFVRDALNHQTSISYSDSFSDGNNSRNTFAYPTTITDADSFQSTSEYKFETGAVTKTLKPAKGTGQGGDTVQYLDLRLTYDSAGRLDKITNQNNSAYTRYYYSIYGEIGTYSTIASTADTAGEAFSVTYFDGAGRLRAIGSDNPNTTGGYRGQFWTYDNMGRLSWQSNPSEMNGSWVPTQDDSAGWVWTTQTYDWKGRPWVTTLPGGATRENTYGGCGCAGGEVTTIRDERGRRRKLTKDILGRLKQVDELNWDQSVYATTSYVYNARDQITSSNQAGQTRSFAYDGYGRLSSKTTPEQGTTGYSYFADDTVQTVTDARNATNTFVYNNRHLVTGITYGVPSGVAATANVSFAYDSAGNRTNMSDGIGYTNYVYNNLSQLTSESRYFSGLASYSLSYTYNLGGEVTSITNPWSTEVGYGYDKTGRPISVSGTGYASGVDYINNITYRAFGVKAMNFTNGKTLSLQYDNRMRVTQWSTPGVMRWDYSYTNFGENTGRVTYAKNLDDGTLDRSYDYDNVGRMWASHSGKEARWHIGQESYTGADGPYAYNNSYDQWGNITARNGWGVVNASYTANYTNNKRSGFTYDASGNVANDGSQTYTYNATGQQATASGNSLTQSYDGDRLRGKKTESGVTTYYLRSSILGGQVIAEINASGGWTRGYVYLGGQLVAIQYGGINLVHQDPVTKSQRITDSSGNLSSTLVDLDPWGGETGRSSNQALQPHRYTSYERDGNGGDDAMMRRHQSSLSRFAQPDPYDGSYDFTDPQSFNRYAYTQNDPVNFVDPSGLDRVSPGTSFGAGILWTVWYGNNNDGWTLVHQWFESYGSPQDQDGSSEARARDLLAQQDCANFISEVISIAASLVNNWGGPITPSFGPMLATPRGGLAPSYDQYYALNEYRRAVSEGRVSFSSERRREGDVITYGETAGNNSITWFADYRSLGRDDTARQLIHESMHLIPNLGDFELAGAASIIATRTRTSSGTTGNFGSRSAVSQYLNSQISRHCR